jgi:deoxyribose-phosphate aldolase
MSTSSDIDRLVETIAERVRLRLADGGGGAGADPSSPCTSPTLTDSECQGCGQCATRRVDATRNVVAAGAERIGGGPTLGAVGADLAGLIDHTLLKQDATKDDVKKLCEDARKHSFATVCVNSTWVPLCKAMLSGTGVRITAVVGFPLGAMAPNAKAFEAREAVRAGADEIDMVMNVGAMKSRDYGTVLDDIKKVVEASRPARVKVILETGALNQEEKIQGITLSKIGGAHFVKTSTGFGPGGATVEDIQLMRKLVGNEMGVKASGGVRTQEDALTMVAAGANRIGASASVGIVMGTAKAPDGKSAKKPGAY